jgi:hypothetical protein
VKHLDLERYYIYGIVRGTGFALACAKCLPQSELMGVGICVGIGPVDFGFESMSDEQRMAMETWRDRPTEARKHFENYYAPLVQQDDTTSLAVKLRGECEDAVPGRDRELLGGKISICS